MTKMRGYIPTFALLATLVFGVPAAQAGIIVHDGAAPTDENLPCEEKDASNLLTDIVTGIASFTTTGIIVRDFAGLDKNDPNETCGIIVRD